MSGQTRKKTNLAGMNKSTLSVLLLVAFWLLPSAASAHPHVWVTMKTEVIYGKGNTVSGFRHHWTFDEFYSAFATQGLDKNKDGKLDKSELEELAKVNVTSLSDFDFFSFPKQGTEKLKSTEPVDYWLEHKDGVLTLHFTLPLEKPADSGSSPVTLSVYDPTFYVSFEYAKENPIVTAQNAPANCKAEVTRPNPQEQQTAANLSEAFLSDSSNAFTIATQLAQDVIVSCAR